MNDWVNAVMVGLLLTNLVELGAGRLAVCIRVLAIQGAVLAALPFLVAGQEATIHAVLLAGLALGLRGGVFPWLLARTLRDVEARREVEPYVGFGFSLLAGLVALGACLWLSGRLPLPGRPAAELAVPVSLFSIFTGLFLIITRKKAITQVIGYLVLENGIYAFGVAAAVELPWLVEAGVLLDVLAAVFVMGIAMFHINREFDHLDADRLVHLRDWHQSSRWRQEIKA